MAKRQKAQEIVRGSYAALPHSVMDSEAFQGASYPARCLLLELMRQLNGSNNGHLQLANSWLRGRGWKSVDVFQRAKAELIERELVIKTRTGGLNIGPDRFAVTWLQISNFAGLDVSSGQFHPGAYLALNQKAHSGRRYGSVPGDGMAKAPTVPGDGTKESHFDQSAIPGDGNNVSIPLPHTNITRSRASRAGRLNGQKGRKTHDRHTAGDR